MSLQIILAIGCYSHGNEALSLQIDAISNALQQANISAELFSRAQTSRGILTLIPDLVRCWHKGRSYAKRQDTIIHIFGSPRTQFFNILFAKAPLRLLTLANTEHLSRKRLAYLSKRCRGIVVENQQDYEELIAKGCNPDTLTVAYPFSPFEDVFSQKNFKPNFEGDKLKIIMASMPFFANDIHRRGIDILIDAAKSLPQEIEITMPCRDRDSFEQIRNILKADNISNIRLLPHNQVKIIDEFMLSHAVVYPHRYRLKSSPNSVIEGLSLALPALVSAKTGIAKIIDKDNCGIVFEPNAKSLITAIKHLKDNYWLKQERARQVYDRYFTKKQFLNAYSKAYSGLLNKDIQLGEHSND